MKRFFLVIITIIALSAAVASYFILVPYSKGARAGVVIKLSEKGFLFKTYEGDMNLGVVVVDNTPSRYGSNDFWSFSVENDEKLIKEIEKSMLERKRVLLRYEEKYIVFPWQGKTKYIVYAIEE